MSQTTLSAWALDHASKLLETRLPERWVHVTAAVDRARSYAPAVGDEADLLVAAVAVHDVGFSPDAEDTGFSTLDGALNLRAAGADERLVALVAHQACGLIEGELRGFDPSVWDQFGPDEASPVRDAMWTSCLTTGPDGSRIDVEERLQGWTVRYPFDWIQRYVELAGPELRAAARRTEERVAAA